jgi:hypothetical protein
VIAVSNIFPVGLRPLLGPPWTEPKGIYSVPTGATRDILYGSGRHQENEEKERTAAEFHSEYTTA